MGPFAWKIAAVPALVGGIAVLALTGNVLLTAGAVLAACLYGFVWERVFAVPDDEEEWPRIGPLSPTTGPRSTAESVYVGAALSVLVLIVAVVIMLLQGHVLWAAATVGAAGVAVLIARSLTSETRAPHRRRRRRRPRSS